MTMRLSMQLLLSTNRVYKLETDLNATFKTNSLEAIWQLKPAGTNQYLKKRNPGRDRSPFHPLVIQAVPIFICRII